MEELNQAIKSAQHKLDNLSIKLEVLSKTKELKSLEEKTKASNFWENSEAAQTVTKKISQLKNTVDPWEEINNELKAANELLAMSDQTIEDELRAEINKINTKITDLEKLTKFSQPYDDHNAIISIYAGAGGTDAQDWTQILFRMYKRWADKKGYKVAVLEESHGEEAGLKSVTFELDGNNAYGLLKGEKGVHRLVRLSPFNSDNLRHTSFAKLDIIPKIEKSDNISIDPKDLKVDVFRSGGHGGQSVNTTDSAVRVTHLPSGISVAIQNERSQTQNKDTAISILTSKLNQLAVEQHKSKLSDIKGPNVSAEWGNQIRNYVLHPYKQVKDLRTKIESKEPDKVLNGEIDKFIDAFIG